jgi:2-polyprenyl-3-methyl-5-hydroxy-6-metoxy-1,4-benzoquinol methylase
MMQSIQCPICHSHNSKVEKIVGHYSILKCQDCSLFWVPGVTDAELSGFYEREYFTGSHNHGYADYLKGEHIHRLNARRILKTALEYLRPKIDVANVKLLDVGCAYGFLVDEACKASFEGEGVDFSVDGSRYAVDTLGLEVHLGSVDSAHYSSEYFDVVTSIGSIEHLSDPIGFVKEAARISKKGGLFIITTIDTKRLAGLFRFKPPEHLYYFSRTNLPILLDANGFNVEKLEGYKSTHALNEALGLLLKAIFGDRIDLDLLLKKLPLKNIFLTMPNNEMLVVARKR